MTFVDRADSSDSSDHWNQRGHSAAASTADLGAGSPDQSAESSSLSDVSIHTLSLGPVLGAVYSESTVAGKSELSPPKDQGSYCLLKILKNHFQKLLYKCRRQLVVSESLLLCERDSHMDD